MLLRLLIGLKNATISAAYSSHIIAAISASSPSPSTARRRMAVDYRTLHRLAKIRPSITVKLVRGGKKLRRQTCLFRKTLGRQIVEKSLFWNLAELDPAFLETTVEICVRETLGDSNLICKSRLGQFLVRRYLLEQSKHNLLFSLVALSLNQCVRHLTKDILQRHLAPPNGVPVTT